MARGVNPWSLRCYCYDSDDCRDDPQTSYRFFAVSNGQIVSEEVFFSDYVNAGFDPSVFEDYRDIRPIGLHDADWEKAWDEFWYRKFYTETRTGQLMVLRPDLPRLYYFPEGRSGTGTTLGAMHKIYGRLGWVLIALVALLLVVLFRIRL